MWFLVQWQICAYRKTAKSKLWMHQVSTRPLLLAAVGYAYIKPDFVLSTHILYTSTNNGIPWDIATSLGWP